MKNWPLFASRITASVSMLDGSVALAAITSSVSTVTIFADLAKCIAFANVTAILRPVKLPGPTDI